MKASLTLRKLVLISNGTHFHLDFHLSLGLSCRVQKLGLAVLTTKKVSPGWTVSGCQHSRRPMVKVIFMKLSVKHATKKVFQKYLKSEDVFLGGTESWSPPSWSTKWVTIQKWLYLWLVPSLQSKVFLSYSYYSNWWTMRCWYPSCWISESRMCWSCDSLDYVNSKMKARSDKDGQIFRDLKSIRNSLYDSWCRGECRRKIA